jgi:uncharacterized membrane protein (DUF4010 family)
MELFLDLGIALAIGLLIGVERGWQTRLAEEGTRIAGIRTFGLLGLLGGIWGLMSRELGELILGLAFVTVAALMITAHMTEVRNKHDVGVTTVVAALMTFALGALALRGYRTEAASAAVVTAILLSMKPVLHSWLQKLESQELFAALKLLLISVVLLPVLPNQGYGPWQALNPYEIWWLVVLIAVISFVGYFAMKIAGQKRGIMYTGIFGGLVSSTAVTLSLSRLAKKIRMPQVLAAGILVSAATMFPRILLEVSIVNPGILKPLLLPMIVMTILAYGSAAWLWYRRSRDHDVEELELHNPLELMMAIRFGALLGLVMLLAEAAKAWMGDAGIYLLALISGLADVDAITLSLAAMQKEGLSAVTASHAIVLAAIANTLVKGILAAFIGGRIMALRVSITLIIVALAGGTSLFFI